MSAARAFVMTEAPGEVLSPSSLNGYLSCSAKFYFRKIEKLPDPPNGALTLGSAVHAAIGANLEQKMDSYRDLPPAGVQAIYLDAWDLLVKGVYPGRHGGDPSLPVEFRDDENPAELKAQGLALTLKYLDEACPEIEPAAVELPVYGRVGGVSVRGYIDLLERDGRVRDLKTAARKPAEISPAYRLQVATYTQICPEASGAVCVDTLVKTKTPQLVQITCQIDQSDVDAVEKQYPLVQRGIRSGWFAPNRESNLCSRKYCAFWRSCQKTFGGKVAE
jgi:hypothetical protein